MNIAEMSLKPKGSVDIMQNRDIKKHIWIAIIVLILSVGYLGYTVYSDQLVVFHDLEVELGVQSITITDFMTEHARLNKVEWVTDPTEINLGKIGTSQIVLRHGDKEQAVKLTVQDTVPPAAEFVKTWRGPVTDLPSADELVTSVEDASAVKIYYLYEPVVPVDYRDIEVTVVVEDAGGNRCEHVCMLSFLWMRESIVLELGERLTADVLLFDPVRDGAFLDQAQLDTINNAEVGVYVVSAKIGGREAISTVTVQDTKGPELTLKEVHCRPDSKPSIEDYISDVFDASGVVDLRMVGLAPDCSTEGKYSIVIEAEDTYGNVTSKETILWVTNDFTPPSIQGFWGTIRIEKHSAPNFLDGVTAYDSEDGECEVYVDTSSLDVDTAGTYYIKYYTYDNSGNVRTLKRKVEVLHDEEDTALLAKSIADTLPDDPEKIRDYVRSTIGYGPNWGGDDPVWFGFTKLGGNCYVHALCLQAVLEQKGYETQVIWTTNETHYWLIVKIGDVWRHMDSTPSPQHMRFSLMTDEERLSTLDGRKWDFESWPACE